MYPVIAIGMNQFFLVIISIVYVRTSNSHMLNYYNKLFDSLIPETLLF